MSYEKKCVCTNRVFVPEFAQAHEGLKWRRRRRRRRNDAPVRVILLKEGVYRALSEKRLHGCEIQAIAMYILYTVKVLIL